MSPETLVRIFNGLHNQEVNPDARTLFWCFVIELDKRHSTLFFFYSLGPCHPHAALPQ